MKNNLIKLFKILLAVLGFASTITSCRVEYGCPYGDFQLKGNVTDENDAQIKGIRVAVSASYPNPDIEGPKDTVYTNEKGQYILVNDYFYNFDKVHLKFDDVDGAENGGEFETMEVDARIVQIEDGRDWYSGTFEASADVTMIKK